MGSRIVPILHVMVIQNLGDCSEMILHLKLHYSFENYDPKTKMTQHPKIIRILEIFTTCYLKN